MLQNNFTVVLAQLLPSTSWEENQARGVAACAKAAAQGADLILFPELWSHAYHAPGILPEQAFGHDHPFLKAFQETAKKEGIAIAITYLEKREGALYNTLSLFGATGACCLTYRKVHLCTFGDFEHKLSPGCAFPLTTLATKAGPLTVGCMICFDREFPESARSLMLKGAELIVVPNACPLKNDPWLGDVRLAQLRARAFENMVGIACTNYPVNKLNSSDGHSCAFMPNGRVFVEAQEHEELVFASFNVPAIKNWRESEVWGAQYRRPHCYEK